MEKDKEIKEKFQKTSVFARLLFGLITIFLIFAFIKMITWALWQNRAPMNPPAWIPIFGLTIMGLVKITFFDDIKLRLHKIWTPLALISLAWVLYAAIVSALPTSTGFWAFILYKTSEAPFWFTGFALLVAFVDWKVIYDNAYYFIFYALFTGVFFVASVPMFIINLFQNGLPQTIMAANEGNDIFTLLSAPFFAYFIILKLKKEWPGWKKIGIAFAIFLVGFFALSILSNFIANFFSPANPVYQILKSAAPPNTIPKGGIPVFN